jgi:hypothetical protein
MTADGANASEPESDDHADEPEAEQVPRGDDFIERFARGAMVMFAVGTIFGNRWFKKD